MRVRGICDLFYGACPNKACHGGEDGVRFRVSVKRAWQHFGAAVCWRAWSYCCRSAVAPLSPPHRVAPPPIAVRSQSVIVIVCPCEVYGNVLLFSAVIEHGAVEKRGLFYGFASLVAAMLQRCDALT